MSFDRYTVEISVIIKILHLGRLGETNNPNNNTIKTEYLVFCVTWSSKDNT